VTTAAPGGRLDNSCNPTGESRVANTAGQRRTSAGTTFRPDIEGLRAVAVLAVVLFHAGVPGIGGGYVGVDVFFVISGFLITGMLWREASRTGTVALARFYAARARRLLPAATIVGVVTAVTAAAVLPPLQARAALGDAIASALYVGNYRFALHGTDYLADDAAPSPFQHYWSLGVEEQFYLLWPALIIGTAWCIRRRAVAGGRRPEASIRPYAAVLAALAVASVVLSLVWTHSMPPWAFFSLPSRAWELALGGLIALSAPAWKRLSGISVAVAGWGGLAVLVASCIELSGTTPYPGTAALLPVLGTALIIGAGCASSELGAGRALGHRSLRTIGRLSYSWYLWHWPVLVLAPAVVGHPLGLFERVATAAISAALAAVTLVLIENPARFAQPLRQSVTRSLLLGATATAAAVCVALTLLAVRPVPVGQGAAAATITLSGPTAGIKSPSINPRDAALAGLTAQIQGAVAASAGPKAVPSNLSPTLDDAPGDKPDVFLNGCVRSWEEVGQDDCASGQTSSPTTVALVGDSHAAMWEPAFTQVAEQRHWRLETLGKVTCPLQDLPITSPYLGRDYTECEQWRGEIMSRLHAEHPALIVLSMSRRYGADFSFTAYDPAWMNTLTQLVAALRATGAAVLVLGPVPDPQSSVPTCLSEHLDDTSACSPELQSAVNRDGIANERAAVSAAGGEYTDLTDLFCTQHRCPAIVGNTLVYRDDNHVTTEYARLLTPVMAALADRALG
jgi:peptidoglycan/LPS O-acetylase OafA/YrhL